jgi:hypothetical protein
MRIELDDEFAGRLEEFRKKQTGYETTGVFIENVMEEHMDSWPWGGQQDVCVRSEECPYWKGVKEWKEEVGL